jgi:hypothetical protein
VKPVRPRRARRWRYGRSLAALATGLAVVAAMVAVTRLSFATADEPDALAAAARIPNDQGTDDCQPAKPPAKPPPPAQSPTSIPPPVPSASPSDNPSPSDSESPSDGASPSDSAGGSDGATGSDGAAAAAAAGDIHAQHRGGKPKPPGKPDCHADQGGPVASDFVDIRSVQPNVKNPRNGRNASTGTFVSVCGNNADGHHNPDNFIVAPGVSNGAHHIHDYVGNRTTDGQSTNESLAAGGTTCRFNDRSPYYWPVLRRTDRKGKDGKVDGGGNDGNKGQILVPTDVKIEFRGNAASKVKAMPQFLRVITGDAKAHVNGPTNARAAWTCSGFENRTTTKYPLCPQGSQVKRILDFPSCWDGKNIDSANHRAQIVFPNSDGRCPKKTVAVPQLRYTISYNVPAGRSFAVDTFPDQLHDPITDHGDFVNVMSSNLMTFAVGCINNGRRC